MACEVVFNTSMTGYLEILTDPSYAGQGVVMTYPMIGNYGVSREDFESIRLQPCAFFLHELCDTPSNFRSTASLESVLNEFDIPCIVGLIRARLSKTPGKRHHARYDDRRYF